MATLWRFMGTAGLAAAAAWGQGILYDPLEPILR